MPPVAIDGTLKFRSKPTLGFVTFKYVNKNNLSSVFLCFPVSV